MNKRQRIIKLIQEDAVDYPDGCKMITYEMLDKADLNPTIEFGEKWTDVHYVIRIAKELGFRGLAGNALHLYPFSYFEKNRPSR